MKYLLKNISRYDVNLGDLRIKIPAGKCINLLTKKAHYTIDDILLSEQQGSISKKLQRKLLIKVVDIREPVVPNRTISKGNTVIFPQRTKSSIVIEFENIDEELNELVMNEDEEYLKQLQMESEISSGTDTPLVLDDEKKTED